MPELPTPPVVAITLDSLLNERLHSTHDQDAALRGAGPWVGPHRGPRRGQGLDFDDLRQYTHGDDVRHIDWNVTARQGTPFTRLYREEKEHVLTLALDLRPSLFTGSDALRGVRAGHLLARMLWHASRNGNRCAVVVQADEKLYITEPAPGDRGALSGCRLIADAWVHAEAQARKLAGSLAVQETPTDLSPMIHRLLSAGRQTGALVLVSGLDHLSDRNLDDLSALAGNRHATQSASLTASRAVAHAPDAPIVIHVEDTIEVNGLPSGTYTYRDGRGRTRQLRLGRQDLVGVRRKLMAEHDVLAAAISRRGLPLLRFRGNDHPEFGVAALSRQLQSHGLFL